MFRIGEFSILTSITINMLRHYDKIGLLVPQYVDVNTGYRYYTKDQLIMANRIVALKSMDFGLREIQELQLGNKHEGELKKLLEAKLESKKREKDIIENQIKRIDEAIRNTEVDGYALSIAIKSIPSHRVVSLRGRIQNFPQEGLLWERLNEECRIRRIRVMEEGIAAAIQHELNYDENYIDIEVQLTTEEVRPSDDVLQFKSIPECQVASIIFQGSYSKVGSINSYLAGWIEQNGYEVYDRMFTIYHNSPRESPREEEFITELCVPIKK